MSIFFVKFSIISKILILLSLLFLDFKQIDIPYIVYDEYIDVICVYIFIISYLILRKNIEKYLISPGIINFLGIRFSLIYIFLENLNYVISFLYVILLFKFFFYQKEIFILIFIFLDFYLFMMGKLKNINNNLIKIYNKYKLGIFIGNLILVIYLFTMIVNKKLVICILTIQMFVTIVYFLIKRLAFLKNINIFFIAIAILIKFVYDITSLGRFLDPLFLSLGILSISLLISKHKYCDQVSIERLGFFLLYLKQILNFKQQQKIFLCDYANLIKKTWLLLLIPMIINFSHLNILKLSIVLCWYILDINLDFFILLFNRKVVDKHSLKNISLISDFGISSAFMLSFSLLTLMHLFVINTYLFLIILFCLNILVLNLLNVWIKTFFADIYLEK
ncbi:hypothetical protein D347_00784 [Enterococcus faecalis LA3B-2]|nr:hypothetical protein D347_00784 [Enterococcus faecalis LA3B-2]